jgi:crossover junction endodeoxyribonuclease RusA
LELPAMARQIDTAMTTLRVVLPLPPSVNNQYVTVGRRRVLSAPARTFDRDVTKLIAALRTSGQLVPELERTLAGTYLGVYLVYFFETPRKRDLDGGLKITLDALGRALGFDDRDVVDMHLSKRIDPLHPRVEVDIETIADWEFDRTYRYLGEVDPAHVTGGPDTAQRDAPGTTDDDNEHA